MYVPEYVFNEMERNFSSMASSKVSMTRTYVLIERAHMLHFLEQKERNIAFLLRGITEAFFKKKERLNIEAYRDFFTDVLLHPNPDVQKMLCFDIYTYSPEKVQQEEKEREEERKARSFAFASPVKPTRSQKSLHNSSSGLVGSGLSSSIPHLTTPAIYRILELPVYMLLKEDLHLMIRELEKKSAVTDEFAFQQEMHRMESSYSFAFSPEEKPKVDSKRSTVYKSFIQMQEALGEKGGSTVNT